MGKPKASIGSIFGTTGWAGGGDVTPNAVNWATVSTNNDDATYTYSERQITGINQTITLQVEISNNAGGGTLYYFVSSNASAIVTGDATSATSPIGFGMNSIASTYPAFSGTFTVTNNQYVTFGVIIGCNSATVTVKNQSDSNVTLDTFVMQSTGECGGCYLTTATVQYKGLLDDGPELTAMRTLREHYRGDVYYDDLIAEYYESSVAIIQGINSSLDPSVDYEFIYQSVLKVKDYVDQSMWEEGWNEYYNAYLTLKNKYI